MSDDETRYFLFRAEEELRAARAASHPDAAKAHYVLAGYYLDLAHNPESRRARPAAPPPEVTGQAAFAEGAYSISAMAGIARSGLLARSAAQTRS